MKLKTTVSSLLAAAVLLAPLPAAAAPAQAAALQPYSYANVKITAGGYAESILYSPVVKGLAYARSDMGGIYRRDSSTGGKWKQLLDDRGQDNYSDMGCESLVADPVDGNRVYALVGMYSTNWLDTKEKTANAKVLRSVNRGETWQETELPFKEGANESGRNFERMTVDPNDTRVLYMGTRNNGLWKSTDAGKTWGQVTGFTEKGDLKDFSYFGDNIGVAWVTIDKASGSRGHASQTMYAGVANTAGKHTIFVSKDSGSTWAPLAGQPTALSKPEASASKTYEHLPYHAALAANGMMYITYCNQAGPYNGDDGDIWKYNTKNGEWTEITPPDKGLGSGEQRCFGYGGLAVSASNPNLLCAATFNEWWPDANIVRSTDGGKTWKSLWTLDFARKQNRINRYTMDYSQSPWLNWGAPTKDTETAQNPKLGWEIGDLSMDPFDNNTVMYGTGASVMKVTNLSALDTASGKAKVAVDANGIEQVVPQALLSPAGGQAHLLSFSYDVGCFVHNDFNKAPSMPQCSGYSITSADMAQNRQQLMAHVGNSDKAFAVSLDGGKTWSAGANCWKGAKSGTVAVSAAGTAIVWAPAVDNANAANAVSVSTDNGKTWKTCSGVPDGAQVVSDRSRDGVFYAYSNGNVYTSVNNGQSFAQTASGLPADSTELRAEPGKAGSLWLAAAGTDKAAGGLWHSTDSGKTFVKTSVSKAGHIGFGKGKASGNALYIVGTVQKTYGFYRSDDNGVSWTRINDDRHQYGSVTCISGDPRVYGRVYLGTNGRGVICGDIAAQQQTWNSDTTVDLNVNGSYTFKITSLNGKTPSLVLGTSGVFQTALVSHCGNAYYYRITAVGKPGSRTGVYMNGSRLLIATVQANNNFPVSDTTSAFSVKAGAGYVFRLTAVQRPRFTAGTPSAFHTALVGHSGSYWYFRVTAAGKPGAASGFYINNNKTPVAVATVRA